MNRLSLPYATLREVRVRVYGARLSLHLARHSDRPAYYRSEARSQLANARALVNAYRAEVTADEPKQLPAPASRPVLRLLCLLVKTRQGRTRALPVHTMQPMPPRVAVSGRWALSGGAGFILREAHASKPSKEVVVRCARQRQANALRADSRAVRIAGLTHAG